jgi:hypothetical protein
MARELIIFDRPIRKVSVVVVIPFTVRTVITFSTSADAERVQPYLMVAVLATTGLR